jgi:hypothetical protein
MVGLVAQGVTEPGPALAGADADQEHRGCVGVTHTGLSWRQATTERAPARVGSSRVSAGSQRDDLHLTVTSGHRSLAIDRSLSKPGSVRPSADRSAIDDEVPEQRTG